MPKTAQVGLTPRQVQNFIDDGFLKIENAFSTQLARQCRDELWADIGLAPDQPEHWIRPVVRIAFKASSPFIEAANAAPLHKAYDQLVGEGRWLVPMGLGTFPIRFPSTESPGDDGWHVDMSFGTADADFMEWRANVKSSGRALLMLFLFSDVGRMMRQRESGKARMRQSRGSCCPMARRARHCGSSLPTTGPRRRIARSNWRPVRQAASICAIRSWFTRRNPTEGNGRASWHSLRCCRRASSIRRCDLRRFRSRSGGLAG